MQGKIPRLAHKEDVTGRRALELGSPIIFGSFGENALRE
jgi:hypothetical protein